LAILAFALAAVTPAAAETAAAAATETAEPAAPTGLAEVIVTAQKVAQRLQDVPVAVTAYSAEDLKRQRVVSLSDLAGITPGLTIMNSAPNGISAAFFSMRGQFQQSALVTVDPSIGVYVDGLYWARAYGINGDMLDMSSAQVLRGPQGTLFGRNTTGGAIVLTSNNPDLNNFSGNVTAGYGRFNYRMGSAVVNAPIVQDKLAVRAAFQIRADDGYVTDTNFNGYKYGNIDQYSGRIKILGKLTDTLSVLASADFYNDNYAPDNGQFRFIKSTGAGNLEAGAEILGGAGACFANVPHCFATGAAAFASTLAAANSTPDVVQYNLVPYTRTNTQTFGLTITDQTPIGEAKLITGYRRVKEANQGDYDGSPTQIANFSTFESLKQWSIEGQLTGRTLHNRFSYATGVFYFQESGRDMTLFAPLPNLAPGLVVYDGYAVNKSIGIYGQGTYEITDKLSLTGGLRWSKDDKSVTIANGHADGTVAGEVPGSFTCLVAAGCPLYRPSSADGISYTAGLDYKFTPDLMVYGKVASAFRSGGVNLRETTAVPGVNSLPFKPERATSFEGGVKSEFLDRRVRFNLSGYYMIVDDIQREFIVADPLHPAINTTIEGNAKQADFSGGEVELTARVIDTGVDSVTLNANAAYVHPQYNDYHDLQTNFDRSRESFAFVPAWQFSVTGEYSHRFDFGTGSLFASYAWDSGYETSNFNYYVDSGGVYHYATDGSVLSQYDATGFYNAMHKNAGGVMNLRASVKFGEGERYEVTAYGENVLNNRQFINTNAVLSLNISGLRQHPATWGLEFSAKF
jgi:iron complex outermembrane receptor protein